MANDKAQVKGAPSKSASKADSQGRKTNTGLVIIIALLVAIICSAASGFAMYMIMKKVQPQTTVTTTVANHAESSETEIPEKAVAVKMDEMLTNLQNGFLKTNIQLVFPDAKSSEEATANLPAIREIILLKIRQCNTTSFEGEQFTKLKKDITEEINKTAKKKIVGIYFNDLVIQPIQ